MYKILKITFLVIFILVDAIGFLMTAVGYLGLLTVGESALPLWLFSPLFAIPIVFIPAVGIAIVKILKSKVKKYRYGIHFWPAIRNVPIPLVLMIYLLLFNLIAIIFMRYMGRCKDLNVIASGMLIFYYVPGLIYLSSIIDSKKNMH